MNLSRFIFLLIFIFPQYLNGQIIINEVLPDPVPGADANGDGIVHNSDDEFIELYNSSGSDLDISGWTIEDGAGVKHVFSNYFLPAGSFVVVFGGGSPSEIPGSIPVVSSTGSLGLNNGGDMITIKNDMTQIVTMMTYEDASDGISLARLPDLIGDFVDHNFENNDGFFSPGRPNVCQVIVNSAASSGLGTLRNAIGCASPGTTISFSSTIMGETILLDQPPIVVDKEITLLADPDHNISISPVHGNAEFLFQVQESMIMDGIRLMGTGPINTPIIVGPQGSIEFKNSKIENVAILNN